MMRQKPSFSAPFGFVWFLANWPVIGLKFEIWDLNSIDGQR